MDQDVVAKVMRFVREQYPEVVHFSDSELLFDLGFKFTRAYVDSSDGDSWEGTMVAYEENASIPH